MRLAWDAVTADCMGQPEAVAGYAVMLMLVSLLTWIPTPDGELVPVYEWTAWTEAGQTVDTQIMVDVPDPQVNGVTFVRVEAIDMANNRSDDACR